MNNNMKGFIHPVEFMVPGLVFGLFMFILFSHMASKNREIVESYRQSLLEQLSGKSFADLKHLNSNENLEIQILSEGNVYLLVYHNGDRGFGLVNPITFRAYEEDGEVKLVYVKTEKNNSGSRSPRIIPTRPPLIIP